MPQPQSPTRFLAQKTFVLQGQMQIKTFSWGGQFSFFLLQSMAVRLKTHVRLCRGLCAQTVTASGIAIHAATTRAEVAVASKAEASAPHEYAPLGSQKCLIGAVTKALAPNRTEFAGIPDRDLANLDGLYGALMQPLPKETTRDDRISVMANTDTSQAAFFQHRELSLQTISHWVRCLGVQGKLTEAHVAFENIEAAGLRANENVYSSLMDACSRAGDVNAAEGVLQRLQRDGMHPNAPVYTALMGAYINAGRHPDEVCAVLERMRAAGVVQDAPSWTCVVQAYLKHRMPGKAWKIFDRMRFQGIDPDAVAFTTVMHACALSDQLEQAQGLWVEMQLNRVQPLLSTHNAFINACAVRCKTLMSLPAKRRRWLSRLDVDIRPESVLELAGQQVMKLQEEGFAADGYTYLALLRAYAALGDVGGAQRAVGMMLDANIAPWASHFHVLLSACVRGMRLKPNNEHENHLEVAMAVPPSMEAVALPVDVKVIEFILGAFAAANRIHRAMALLDELPAKYAVSLSPLAFDALLLMAQKVRRPALAQDLLQRMQQSGINPTEAQLGVPDKIERDRQPKLRYPPMPKVSYSKNCGGFIHPRPSIKTTEKWVLFSGNRARQKRIKHKMQTGQQALQHRHQGGTSKVPEQQPWSEHLKLKPAH